MGSGEGKMQHRKDIEGLRAVAILLVVAGHAGFPGLAGGFIGVDVFFVLSGFLITGLLVVEHGREGKIDFRSFYSRRFRRLLPALAVMLLVTGALATQLVPPVDRSSHALAGVSAALWLSNIHFAVSDVDYFSGHDNLYLHTWSLGVEEQFYLFWPLLLALFLPRGYMRMQRVYFAFILLGAISFTACLLLSWMSAPLAFYLTPMRAWQFALGGLVWLHFFSGRSMSGTGPRWSQPIAAMAATTGLFLIAIAAVWLNSGHRYPGLWALLPTLGTCFVLAAGSVASQTSLPLRALASAPMQWLGRMSYGWYLWHWPFLILGAAAVGVVDGWLRAGLMIAALIVAWASFHLIESPIRRSRRWPLTPARTIIASLAVMACVSFVGARQMTQAQAEAGEWRSAHRITVPKIYGAGCDRWYQDAELTPCVIAPPGAAVSTVVVLGDSIGLQWFPALERLAEAQNWELVILTKSACPIVDHDIFYSRIGRDYVECSEWREQAISYISRLVPDAVIIGSSPSYDFSEEQWVEGTRRILDRLSPIAGEIGVLRGTPILPFSGVTCLSFQTPLRDWLSKSRSCTASATSDGLGRVAGYLTAAATGYGNVRVIDLNELVCPDGVCHAERDGVLVYRDTQHLNADFVEALTLPILGEIKKALPKLFSRGSDA